MNDWKECYLENLLSEKPEYGANASGLNYSPLLPRFLRITDIDDDGQLIKTDKVSVQKIYLDQYKLQQNDILIARTGNTVGKSYLYNQNDGELVFAGYLIRFRIDERKAIPQYIFHYLKSQFYKSWVKSTLRIGAQPNINAAEYCSIKFLLPVSIEEQRKIARILSTADAVIEKTRAAIAKYKAVKQGMLHDLFTRGIDPHTGTLRPKPADAPELYKDSPLGKVPKDWEVERLGQRAVIDYGKSQKLVTSINGTIPVYGTGGLMEFATDFLFDGESILIGRKGTIDKPFYLTGKFWVVDTTYFLSYFAGNIKWLYYKLNNFGLGKLNEATGVPSLNRELFYKILFAFPEKNEQDEIVNRVSVIDSKIQTEQNYLAKLQSIKAGLMADLLSGKVKVKSEK